MESGTPSAKASSKFFQKKPNTESSTQKLHSSLMATFPLQTCIKTCRSSSCPIHVGFHRPGLSRAFINNGQANKINSGAAKPEGIKRPEISLKRKGAEKAHDVSDVILT